MSNPTNRTHIEHFIGTRLRVRKVREDEVLEKCIKDAQKNPGVLTHRIQHGGGVANAYNYPAETEWVFVAAIVRDGITYARRWVGRIPANKVTFGGIANRLGVRALYDCRYGNATTTAAEETLLRQLNALDINFAPLYIHDPLLTNLVKNTLENNSDGTPHSK